jgi:beta-ribofuranosylaminobenzene 5'-phosphate synthase
MNITTASVLVTTPARIAACLLDMNGALGRVDGTLGIALDFPSVQVRVSPAPGLEVVSPNNDAGPLSILARRCLTSFGTLHGALIEVEDSYEPHSGLGLTTQLRLAVIAGLSKLANYPMTIRETGQAAGRGGTSGAGLFAFHLGGVTLDGGHTFGPFKEKQGFIPSRTAHPHTPPLLARHQFPDAWRIVCVTAENVAGKSGEDEVGFFARSCPVPASEAAATCRLVLMSLLPGIVAQDLPAVSVGIDELQQTGFKSRIWQMQDKLVLQARIIMRRAGLTGIGLSSLGPTVYSVVDADEADSVVENLRSLMAEKGIGAKVWATAVSQTGASIRTDPVSEWGSQQA